MTKFLATKKTAEKLSPLELIQHAQQNWSFIEKPNKNFALISPFVIITDGKNILMNQDEMEAEIGFRFFIEKPRPCPWRHTASNYNFILHIGIQNKLFDIFDKIEIKSTDESRTFVNPRELFDSEEFFVDLIPANRGGFNYSGNKFLPIFFLKTNPEKIVNFYPHLPMQLTTISIEKLIQTGLAEFPNLGYCSKSAFLWISSGEILFPSF